MWYDIANGWRCRGASIVMRSFWWKVGWEMKWGGWMTSESKDKWISTAYEIIKWFFYLPIMYVCVICNDKLRLTRDEMRQFLNLIRKVQKKHFFIWCDTKKIQRRSEKINKNINIKHKNTFAHSLSFWLYLSWPLLRWNNVEWKMCISDPAQKRQTRVPILVGESDYF